MDYLPYILIGAGVVLVILIIVIILLIHNKKKKVPSTKEKEDTSINNVNEEPKPVIAQETKEVNEEISEAEPIQNVVEEKQVEPVEAIEQPVVETQEDSVDVEDDTHYEDMTATQEISLINSKKAIGKYVISSDGIDFRYRLKASNGEILVVSEPYASEKSVRAGIETLKRNLDDETLDFIQDKHGLFSFRVMTKQGRFLATSANYKTKQAAISASESFKRFAVTDRILLAEQESDHSEVEEFNEVVETEAKGKFVFVPCANEEFSFQLLASNGKVIATSQPYHSYNYCKEGIEKFKVLAYDGKFLVFKDKNNRYQFKLYNSQKRLFLAGEVYDTKDRVLNVIRSIRRFAKQADTVEYTAPVEETK